MIVVEGKVRGKGRPRFGKGFTYTPKETVEYEKQIRECYQKQSGIKLEGSVQALVVAYYKIPKSYSKKRVQAIIDNLEHPRKKPDIDNCVKAILDAINGIAYEDDSQVVKVVALKKWTTGMERVEFSVGKYE